MKNSWLKDRNAQIILACVLAILFVYSVNVFRIAYQLTSWESFGETSIVPAKLQFFLADTPDIIGYIEKDSREKVECAEAVAYVEIASGETYRCCQADRKVSCVSGDFSSDIPATDPACASQLSATLGVPATMPDAKDYLIYGVCPEGGNPELTVAQIDASNQIQWKSLTTFELGLVNSALRCVIGPALLLLIIRIVVIMRRKPDPNRQIRKW